MSKAQTPCLLIILDGWGINPKSQGNAVLSARTPHLEALFAEYPHTQLLCAGEAVGLPEGFMGNSEVGHLNIGSGRIVYQELLKINLAIKDGSFFNNHTFSNLLASVQSRSSTLHLIGLVSDGGVHSHIEHLKSLVEMACERGTRVCIHVILDGRDTPPDSGKGYIADLQEFLATYDTATIATICGRYYAMDRDTRWDRTKKAYDLYTLGQGLNEADPVTAVQNAYNRGETDEFVTPIVIRHQGNHPAQTITDGDGIIFFNFRADRVRQIVRAMTDSKFSNFNREKLPQLCDLVCLTSYDDSFDLPVAFPPRHLNNTLGEVISLQGYSQLRLAETEKYAHVTYFFNGGREEPFDGEERQLIASPREVATYDKKPEMSAPEVTDKLIAQIRRQQHDLLVVNYANLDMVGHTGLFEAAVSACEIVDQCVGKVVQEFTSHGGVAILIADHGNAEQMENDKGGPYTAHTLNPVPLILVDKSRQSICLSPGKLGDVAPTILKIMGIKQPPEMTGKPLF